MNSISVNLTTIRQRIASTCARVGKDPSRVQLVAVSKTKPAALVMDALEAGQIIFGENRIQEARDKVPTVNDARAQWHLIGPLQRNKVKYAVKLFHMIHSVDSIALAEALNKRYTQADPLSVLIQVNIGGETQKHGVAPDQAQSLIRAMADMKNLAVKGLMTVPPYHPDQEQIRPYFRDLAQLAEDLKRLELPSVSMDELSMGMSHDFETAVEEGATLVRVGSAIFGNRG
ncbi:MAG: YggS family pyridoxal phosphate-dependent enzyme [Magnetococcales bacterium]|nr:YggS family pyridoxal phosphate-dependent enzyme [Magnetococcales bacterium]